MVDQADSTLTQIKQKVRRLVMAGDPSILPDREIERQINTFVEQDFPFSLRINEFIERKNFYTVKGIDRYSVDINTVRTLTGPALVSGQQAEWYQDFTVFNRIYPINLHPDFIPGQGVAGPYEKIISASPVLRREVVVSTILSTGVQEVFEDDGNGNLVSQMPGSTGVGTINYLTGELSVIFGNTVDTGQSIDIQFFPITLSRPRAFFFRNNEIILRPVPDRAYKVEYDAYIIPTAFLEMNQSPNVNFWWEYIAYGAAKKILEDRQDADSLAVILPVFREKETIIVEQTAIQDGNMRSPTIYTLRGLHGLH